VWHATGSLQLVLALTDIASKANTHPAGTALLQNKKAHTTSGYPTVSSKQKLPKWLHWVKLNPTAWL